MKQLLLIIALITFASSSYAQPDENIFNFHSSQKNEIRETKFYKDLSKSLESSGIVTFHDKIYKTILSKKEINPPELLTLITFLEDSINTMNDEVIIRPYLFDLHAISLTILSKVTHRFGQPKTEADRKFMEDETQRYAMASVYRAIQWKILAEEDLHRCKYSAEPLAFFQANLKKYKFDQNMVKSIGKDNLVKAALEASKRYENRPPNTDICKLSKEFTKRLMETGTPIYATKQENGEVLIHMDTKETPITKDSIKLDTYINTGQITPEIISDNEWNRIREKIRNNFSNVALNASVL